MVNLCVRVLLVLSFLTMMSGPAWGKAYGPWCLTLYSKYCTGSTWEKWGCKGYIHYRLDWNRTRSAANSACKNSCNRQTPNDAAKNACLKGCQNALSQEK